MSGSSFLFVLDLNLLQRLMKAGGSLFGESAKNVLGVQSLLQKLGKL